MDWSIFEKMGYVQHIYRGVRFFIKQRSANSWRASIHISMGEVELGGATEEAAIENAQKHIDNTIDQIIASGDDPKKYYNAE
jgi:hypothetical protein